LLRPPVRGTTPGVVSDVEQAREGKIRVLDAEMANQIAAGEVIENPASVVKELVENSLDAGARKVTVVTEGASTDLIRIIDDGEGMGEADAVLALERHATSKIRAPEDLTAIATLGFRGEALPSIASVSRLTLVTKPRGAVAGTQVVAVPGEPLARTPIGAPEGTRVEVRDLFFNTPARRKFLKSQSTETARITELVARLALCRPAVAFTLVRNGKPQRSYLTRASLAERVREVVGADVELRDGAGGVGPVSVEAWLSGPEGSRVGSRALHLLVNGRLVRDQGLARAIWYAYDGTLDQGNYPAGVVSITIDPGLIDVNVHPQKAEVRFVDRGMVHGAVARVVGSLIQDRASYLKASSPAAPHATTPATTPLFEHTPWLPTPAAGAAPPPAIGRDDRPTPLPAAWLPPAAPAAAQPAHFGALRFLGPAGSAWLVCEGPEGLVIIDQHAAHERITFERLRDAYRTQQPAAQQLLVAEQVEVSPRELDQLAENGDQLRAIGFEVEPFSTTAVTIAAVPAPLGRADPRRLLDEVLAELSELQAPLGAAIDRLLARLACHGSVRAGTRLAREEVEALLRDLDAAKLGGHCPHGRPVSLNLSWAEIERRLGRRS
jgi:DNA mismatch repair protein MutL